jgi:hypothetical protein
MSDAPNYDDIYQDAGDKTGLDPDLLRAKDYVESRHDRFAVSPAGAEGVSQLMPGTAKEVNVTDTFDPKQSIHGGAEYLRRQYAAFGDPYKALAAYNAGPHGDFSNPETTDYVNKVADKWDEYRQQKLNRQAAPKPLSFDDLPDKAQGPLTFDDLPDAKPGGLPLAKRDEGAVPEAEDTGFIDAAKQGLLTPIRGGAQTAQSITGKPQASANKPIKAAEPMGWSDLKDPKLLGEKALYGFAASFPEMAGFMAGSVVGGGPETPIGMGTGALGAAIAHTAVSFGPAFRSELDQSPNDPDGAFNRAMAKTGVGSVATGLGFAAFGAVNPFQSGLKNLVFQAFGVQPAISGAGEAATNVMEGKPATEGLAASYPAAVLGTVVPAAAMHGAGMMLPKGGRQTEPPPGQAPPQPGQQGTDRTPVSPPEGGPAPTGIPNPVLPDNYFPDRTVPTGTGPTPEPPAPPPAPEPTPAPAPPPPPPPAPPPAVDPLADAHHTLDAIIAGVDPKAEPTPPQPEPPRPVPAPPEPTPEPPPAQPEPAPPSPTPPPPAPVTPEPPKSGSYVMLDPAQLNVDPARFQFKASDPEKGVTGALRGTDRWEPSLADPITAWQDNDGKMWVANGHQRTDLANRAIAAGQQDVQIPAKIYREADGYTPAFMRALGAYQNIAQGSGTAIDAAKIMREVNKAPGEFQLPTLPPNSALTKQATGLAKLSDEAFGAVVNEVVPAAYAAHVGDLIKDPAEQVAAIGMLARGNPANADQARMMVQDIRNSGFLQDTQSTLFGEEAFAKSLFPERAKVLDGALKTLRGNKSVYRAAVTGEDALTAAGNKMDSDANIKAKAANDQLIDHLDRNATTKGPLSDALTAAATDLAAGKPLKSVVSQFLGKARDDHASGGESRVERGVDHGGTDAPGEDSETGRIEAVGQDGLLEPKGRIFDRSQSDLFGGDQKPRAQVTPPKPKPAQLDMFGRHDAAIQAQAKRDQEGRGALMGKGDQKKADQGLFADRMEGQGSLISSRPAKSALGTFPMQDKGRHIAGRDLTSQVTVRPGETGQRAAARFVIDRGETTGHEYLTAVDNQTGQVIHAGTNDMPGAVGWNLAGRKDLVTDSLTVHHNHPGGSGFSPDDLMLLYHPALSHMVAHAEGDIFAAKASSRNVWRRDPDGGELPQKMLVLHKAAEVQARQMFRAFWPHLERSPTEADINQVNKSFYDVIARLLHGIGEIDYISTRPMHPAMERMMIDRLAANGRLPNEIAGAIRVYTKEEAEAALPHPTPTGAREDAAETAVEHDRDPSAIRPGGGAAGIPEAMGRSGARPGSVGDRGGADSAPAARGQDIRRALPLGEGARSGTQTPVTPPPQGPAARFISKARDLYENGRTKLYEALTEHFTPIAGGSKRAMDIAVQLANNLREVNYQFKLLDDHVKAKFNAKERETMGIATDQQTVLEQTIKELRENNAAQGQLGKPMMSAAQMAHAETTMRAQWAALGHGVETLPPNLRAMVEQYRGLSRQTWQRMEARGMVAPGSEGLDYYFARFILQHDDQGNIVKPKGRSGTGPGNSDIHEFGRNLSTSGPMRRNHLTPEDTIAAAQAALKDPNAFLLRDIRAIGLSLARNERAIAGKDFIDGIKRIGVANGGPLLVSHGGPPAGPHDGYFTIDGHPSFQQWFGDQRKPIYVSNEFKGPINAVLTKPGSAVYQAAMKAKGASMSAIMWSPLMHLNVIMGKALPLLRGQLFSSKLWSAGKNNSLDPGYMQNAIRDGLAPIGQSWREDAASIAEQADMNRKPPGPLGKFVEGWHNLHQKVLWDNIFHLQVGIYDSLRTQFLNHGFDARTAGVAAAHEANRFAGTLPSENLSRWANMTSNLLLFSRSFTLGNLGIMKDALVGLPRQTRAVIEQHAGADVAKKASDLVRRKAQGAVLLDIGLAYLVNTIVQEAFSVGNRASTMGIGPALQSTYDDWAAQAKAALQETGEDWNPMHLTKILPQGNNEPHKTNRAFVGKDETGRGIYLRTSAGKVGEEFLGYGFSPLELLWNKTSPWIRPMIEDVFGEDTLGRKIYKPNPASFSDYLANAGRAVTHVMKSLGPIDQVEGAYELGKQVTGHGDKGADPLTQGIRTLLPATGLGQISSGFPGGPQAGKAFSAKQTLQWQQQQAMQEARKQYKNGDADQARQTLLDAGTEPKLVKALLKYMNESAAQAAAQRFINRRMTPAQRRDVEMTTTGDPLQ